uniref:Uncharacterized protein n=1 Tax=Arundo donax TaxID=35708 RepID=A0A0A9ERR4_ARUDO
MILCNTSVTKHSVGTPSKTRTVAPFKRGPYVT